MLICLSSWQIDGETVETVADFIFLGSKITADADFSNFNIWKNQYNIVKLKNKIKLKKIKNKRRLLLGRKVMSNLDSIFKSRDITLPTKVRLVKAMVFPVIMYRCESWIIKKADT